MSRMRKNSSVLSLLAAANDNNVLAMTGCNAGKEREAYNNASRATKVLIDNIAKSRDLPLMIEAEIQLRNDDLVKYAKTGEERENVKIGLKNFKSGLIMYDVLLNEPNRYRKDSVSYFGAQRDKTNDVPMDGMRRAIGGQLTRLQNRHALTNTTEEKDLLSARRDLLQFIRSEYVKMQKEICQEAGKAAQMKQEGARSAGRGISR